MGNKVFKQKSGRLLENTSHTIDLLNLQSRESLLQEQKITSKLDALSKEIRDLSKELKRSSSTHSDYKFKPRHHSTMRKDREEQHDLKPHRMYSVRNPVIEPSYISGHLSSQ